MAQVISFSRLIQDSMIARPIQNSSYLLSNIFPAFKASQIPTPTSYANISSTAPNIFSTAQTVTNTTAEDLCPNGQKAGCGFGAARLGLVYWPPETKTAGPSNATITAAPSTMVSDGFTLSVRYQS